MPRTITVPVEGSAPRLRVDTHFGVFRENTHTAKLVNVSGLSTVVKLSGAGQVGSINITVADPNGSIKNLLDSVNVHKTPASIYQEIETTSGSVSTVLLFKGEVSSPIVWNPSEGSVSFDIVSVIETEEIGFSVQQSDFEDGETIQGLRYINGTPVYTVPSTLEGKAWPLVFGSCIHVPAVGFTMEEDPTSEDPDDADILPEGIVASDEWFPIEPSFVAQYINACRSAAGFKPGQKFPILRIIQDEAVFRIDSFKTTDAQGVESRARAWAGLVQLNKKIRTVHPNKVDEFLAIQEHVLGVEFDLLEFWNETPTIDFPKESYSTFEHFREAELGALLSALVDIVLQPEWPSIALNPNHGLRRGQDPENINLLPGDEPNIQYYRINNAKVAGHITTDNVLQVYDIVATYKDINIVSGGDDPTMFKVSVQNSDELDECDSQITARAIDLNGMFLKVSAQIDGFNARVKQLIKVDRHVKIPQKDGNGAILKDDNGNVLYEQLSEVYYTPLFLILDSEDSFDDLAKEAQRDYRVAANLVVGGTIEEAAPFVLPIWGLNHIYRTDPAVAPIIIPDTWVVNARLILPLADAPKFEGANATPLKSIYKMGASSFTISNGDAVTEFFDVRTGDNSCEDDDSAAQAWTWICNQMHTTVIKAVYAYRSFRGQRIFTLVPSRYFSINDSRIIANQECTVLELPKKLSQYDDEDWEDQLFVTMTSPVGPNTALICKWMIEQYSDYIADPTTFTETQADLANYPSNFAILDQRDLLSTLEDIAWQCRCVIYISDDTIYMRYLAKEGTTTSTVGSANIIEGSVSVELSITEKLVTKLTGLWKPNYQDLDINYKLRPLRRINLRNNVDLYGVMEDERELWIYNIRSLVVKSLRFWLIRWSNTWKRAKFETTLASLDTETFDTFTLDLSGVVSTAPVDVIAESISYDSQQLKLIFDTWTPVRAGEMVPFDLAYLA